MPCFSFCYLPVWSNIAHGKISEKHARQDAVDFKEKYKKWPQKYYNFVGYSENKTALPFKNKRLA